MIHSTETFVSPTAMKPASDMIAIDAVVTTNPTRTRL